MTSNQIKFNKYLKHSKSLVVVSLCYNESKIIPYLYYYVREYATQFIVYDNKSVDNSVELLLGYDIPVTVFEYNSNNEINDFKYLEIKNNAYNFDSEFIIVQDMDEFLFSTDWSTLMNKIVMNGCECCFSKWYEMISRKDIETYPKNFSLHNNIKYFVKPNESTPKISTYKLGKPHLIFKPALERFEFTIGQHNLKGISNPLVENQDLYCFHMNMIGFEYYIQKQLRNKCRLSMLNLKEDYGIQYTRTEKEVREDLKYLYNHVLEIGMI